MTSLLIIFSQNYPGDLLEITCFFPSRFPVYSLRLYIYMPVVLFDLIYLLLETRLRRGLGWIKWKGAIKLEGGNEMGKMDGCVR